jgi:cation:H+ antiporter
MLDILFFLISIPLLVKGSDLFIEGASRTAKHLGVSDFLIGVTIVALGTSLPELASDTYASYIDQGDVVLGDILGSNITNVALILGLTAVIRPLPVKHEEVFSGKVHLIVLVLASMLLVLGNGVSRLGGLILIISYIFYIRHVVGISRMIAVETAPKGILWRNLLELSLGLGGILLGARILVDSIIGIAHTFGIPEYLIALIMMSLGTSLPELSVSIAGARKGYMTMVLGNIIGSNVGNILFVLGLAAMIRPISIGALEILPAIGTMLFLSLLLVRFKATGYLIDTREGVIFLAIYGLFIGISTFL